MAHYTYRAADMTSIFNNTLIYKAPKALGSQVLVTS